MTHAVIIKNGSVIANVNTNLKNGAIIEYADKTSTESINANREQNLVNAKSGKISRAKKYMKNYEDFATEINPGEFLI